LSRDRTLDRLRDLIAHGEVRAPRVSHDAPDLHRAALAHFGTFANALREAGIGERPARRLTRAALIADLRKLHARGVRMSASGIVDAGRNDLMSAVHRHFGGIANARVAARIAAPSQLPREVRWGREAVIRAIQLAHARGEPLSHSRVDRDLFRGALNSFRGWRAAIEAAGINYESVRIRPDRYSDEELLEILRSIHAHHPEMTLSALHLLPPHGNTLRQRFGDLRAAARRVGIRNWPRRVKAPPLSAEETLRRLRARAGSGKSYAPLALALHAPRVLQGVRLHFGRISAAVAAAGIVPTLVARRDALIEAVLAAVRERKRARRSIRRVDVMRESPQVVKRAAFYFGGWGRAVKVALRGTKPRSSDFGGLFARRRRLARDRS
jgi:hypothetical protein